MLTNSHDFARPSGDEERAWLESLVREDFARHQVDETFDDMKRRMPFSREDQGLYREWMALAAVRAEALTATASRPHALPGQEKHRLGQEHDQHDMAEDADVDESDLP
jgi:hypothetical protein